MIAATCPVCVSSLARTSARTMVSLERHSSRNSRVPARTARAVRGLRARADGPVLLLAGPLVGPDGQQPGQLALGPGVGLDRDPVIAGDLGQTGPPGPPPARRAAR